MTLDLLVIAAHPDDAELACGGVLAKHVAQGKSCGILDLTEGEMGTRGSVAERREEAAAAAKILGLSHRENLGLPDGFLQPADKEQVMAIVRAIRRLKPALVLANAPSDRHPDHGKGSKLAKEACFLAGLQKIETEEPAFRPQALFYYIQDRYLSPDLILDVTAEWETKVAAIRAYKSQFFNPAGEGPQTYISRPEFLDYITARAQEFGHAIGTRYAEGFVSEKALSIDNFFDLSFGPF